VKVREYGNAIKQYVYKRGKEASPPNPNKRKEKENKASPPAPLQGEGSKMPWK